MVDDKIYFLAAQKAVGTQDETMLGNKIISRRDIHVLQNLKSTGKTSRFPFLEVFANSDPETFASKIGEELLNLLNKKRYCDVTLHFADQKIDAHKIVLAARSIPFRRILLRIKDKTDPQEIRKITQEVIGEYKQRSADKLKASQEIINKHNENPDQPQETEENQVEKLLKEDEDEDNKNKEMTEEEKQLEEEQKGKDEHKIFLNQHSDIYLEEFDYNTFKQMVRPNQIKTFPN